MKLPLAFATLLLVHAAHGAGPAVEVATTGEEAADEGKGSKKPSIEPMTDEEEKLMLARQAAEVTEWDDLLTDAHMALMEEDMEKMKESFSKVPDGANNKRYVAMHGMPPLWFAIHNQQTDMVKWLLKHGNHSVDYKEEDITDTDENGTEHFFKGDTVFDLVKEPDPNDEEAYSPIDDKEYRKQIRDVLDAHAKDEL